MSGELIGGIVAKVLMKVVVLIQPYSPAFIGAVINLVATVHKGTEKLNLITKLSTFITACAIGVGWVMIGDTYLELYEMKAHPKALTALGFIGGAFGWTGLMWAVGKSEKIIGLFVKK